MTFRSFVEPAADDSVLVRENNISREYIVDYFVTIVNNIAITCSTLNRNLKI